MHRTEATKTTQVIAWLMEHLPQSIVSHVLRNAATGGTDDRKDGA